MGDIEYERALKGIAAYRANPGSVSADTLEYLVGIVKAHKEKAAAPKYAPNNPMGEPTSMFSFGTPRSIDEGMTQTEEPQAYDPRREDAYNAFGPKRKGEPELPQREDHSPEGEQARSAHEQWFASLHDHSLPSASKMQDIYKPPSYIAKPPPADPSNPLAAAAQAIASARSTLPSFVGGSADHYFEPSLDQFKRDMYPVLGPHVMNMTENDEQYKQYADMQWKKVYDQAVAENRTAIRHSFATGEGNGAFTKAAMSGAHALTSAAASVPVAGKAAARLIGGQEGVENAENVASQAPVSSLAGSLYGGSKLLAPLEALAPAPTTALGRIGKSAATGGAFGAGATAADEALGSKPTSAGNVAKDAGMAGLLGIGAGTAFGAFGELPRAYRANVIDSPDLKLARQGGAETSVLKGIKAPPDSEIGRLQAEAEGLGLDPMDYTVSRLRAPLSDAALKESELAKLQHGNAMNEYEAQTANHRQAVTDLFDVATKGRAEQVGPDGRSLAVGPEESNIRKIQNTVATVKPLREHYQVVKVLEPGDNGLLEQAKAMYGNDVAEKIAAAKAKPKAPEPVDALVATAKPVPPAEAGTVRPGLREQATGVEGKAQPKPAESTLPSGPNGTINLDTLTPPKPAESTLPSGPNGTINLDTLTPPKAKQGGPIAAHRLKLENQIDMARVQGNAAAEAQAKQELARFEAAFGAPGALESHETPPGYEAWGNAVDDTPVEQVSKITAEMHGLKKLTDAELMTAKGARAAGLHVDPNVADNQQVLLQSSRQAPPGGKIMDAHEAMAQGFEMPKGVSTHEKVVVAPRLMNPSELKATIDSIDALQRTGRNVPKVDELQRAAREIRDRFPEVGPVAGARATIEDKATGQKKDLKGYSAAQHNYAEESSARELRNKRAGLLPRGEADEAQTFDNVARGYGLPGRAPEIDESLRSAAALANKSKELEFVRQMRAYQKLHGSRVDPMTVGRAAMGRIPYASRSTMEALNLHLDPILAGRAVPNAGVLGGVTGYSQGNKVQPTFDQINEWLNPNPGP